MRNNIQMKNNLGLVILAIIAILLVFNLGSDIEKHTDEDFDRIEAENQSLRSKLQTRTSSFSTKVYVEKNKKHTAWDINTDNFHAIHINKPDPNFEMHIKVWYEPKGVEVKQ